MSGELHLMCQARGRGFSSFIAATFGTRSTRPLEIELLSNQPTAPDRWRFVRHSPDGQPQD
jgi:hypothetical protein